MGAESSVKLRLQVLEEGLGNLTKLIASLEGAGKETQALTDYSRQLAAEQARLARDQGLIENFARQKSAVQASKDAMAQAQAEAQRLGRALAQTDEPTKAQTREFEAARQAVGRAKQAYQDQVLQLERSRKALADTGIESDKLADAQARISRAAQEVKGRMEAFASQLQSAAPPAKTLESTADAADAALRRMGNGAESANGSLGKTRAGVESISTQLKAAKEQVAAFFAAQTSAQAVGQIIALADAWQNMQARLRLALGEQVNMQTALADVERVAMRTYSSLNGTAELYGKLAVAGKEMGVSQQEALRLTQTINEAVQLSGASTQASEAALTQLIQGLQSGVIRGDEFNSIMEQAPRLAQAMADGLGVPRGALRGLAEQGQLTAQVVIGALQRQSTVLDAEFGKLPVTVGRATENLRTQWARLVGTWDSSSGATATLAQGIEAVANNLDELAAIATRAGSVVVAAMAVQAVGALRAAAAEMAVTGGAAKLLALDLAKLSKPVQITIAVVGFEIGYQIGQLLYENSEYARKLGVGLVAFFQNIVNDLQFVKEAGAAIFSDDTVEAALDRYRQRGKELDEIFSGLWDDAKDAPQAVGNAADQASSHLNQIGQVGQAAGAAVAAGVATGTAGLGGMAAQASAVDAAISQVAAVGKEKLPQIGPTAQQQADAMAALAGKSQEVADKVGKEIPTAIAKLSGTDLAGFRDRMVAAFADSQANAALLEQVLVDVGKQAAQNLGVDVAAAATKVSAEFEKATADSNVLIGSLDALKAAGVDTSVVVGQALNGMVNTAKNQAELDALTARVNALRTAGQLTEVQYIALTASISAKAQDVAANVNSVADALLGKFGTSVQEVQTGISATSTKAIGDLDALTRTLDALGVKGEDTAPILTRALDQTLQAANTAKEIEEVIRRWKELGAQGKVTGDQLAEGVGKAKTKLDEVKPGINSTSEALSKFGLTSRAEMQRTAETLGKAWKQIQNDASESIANKRAAFEKYARAVMDANGGVVTAELKVQAEMLGVELAAKSAGAAGAAGMHQIRDAAQEAAGQVRDLSASLRERNEAVKSSFEADAAKRTGSGTEAGGNTLMSVINTLKGYGLDDAAAQKIAREFVDGRGEVPYMNNPGQVKYGGPGGGTLSSALQAAASQYLYGKDGTGGEVARRTAAANAPAAAPAPAPAPTPAPAPAAPARVYAVQITLAGRTETISTSSDRDAQALMGLIKQLETEAARAAGGTS